MVMSVAKQGIDFNGVTVKRPQECCQFWIRSKRDIGRLLWMPCTSRVAAFSCDGACRCTLTHVTLSTSDTISFGLEQIDWNNLKLPFNETACSPKLQTLLRCLKSRAHVCVCVTYRLSLFTCESTVVLYTAVFPRRLCSRTSVYWEPRIMAFKPYFWVYNNLLLQLTIRIFGLYTTNFGAVISVAAALL